jgi:hypothetical protein
MILDLSAIEIFVTELTRRVGPFKTTNSLNSALMVSNSRTKYYLKAKTKGKFRRTKLTKPEVLK